MSIPAKEMKVGTPTLAGSGKLISDMLARYSMSAYWFPAVLCSCWGQLLQIEAESGSPDPGCPTCSGKGYLYADRFVVDGVMFSNMRHATQWDDTGMTIQGDIMLTIPATYGGLGESLPIYGKLGFRDVVISQDLLISMPHIVKRGRDIVRYDPVEVIGCFWGSKSFAYGVDFTITKRAVIWLTSNSPPAGSNYQIEFTFHPIYIVMDQLPVVRAFAHISFPHSYKLEEDPNLADLLVDARPVG